MLSNVTDTAGGVKDAASKGRATAGRLSRVSARRVQGKIDRLAGDLIPYYLSQIRAWSGDDNARGRRNVAIFTERLTQARASLAVLVATRGGCDGA